MAIITFNTRKFVASMRALRKGLDEKKVRHHVERMAKAIIDDSRKAPIPYRKGDLSRSGQVEVAKDNTVVLGFDRVYATVQDLGSPPYRRLLPPGPPKAYGSAIGPNLYFSETFRRWSPFVIKDLGTEVEQTIREITLRVGK
jgi:hypothetical protein